MKEKIIRSVSFVCLTLLVLAGVYKVLSWKDTSGDYLSVTSQLYHTDRDLMDVVFVGSSHVYTSIYPALMWQSKGISAFDMSLSEQDKDCSYHCLKELLKTQTPQVVCVEMYGLMFDEHSRKGDAYRNVLALRTSKNSVELAYDSAIGDDVTDYLLRWPIVHTRYRELKRNDFRTNKVNYYGRGAVMGWGNEVGYMNPDVIKIKDITPLSEKNKAWIDSIYELSQEYGFQLVFFVAPDFESAEEKMISNGAREYAATLGIDYLDFTELAESIGFIPELDMGDLVHCNADGAKKITSYFSNYLENHFELTDHRGDGRYEYWDEDYRHYENIVVKRALSLATNAEECLWAIKDSKDLTAIISLDGDFGDTCDYLDILGIDPAESIEGGKWLYSDGTVTKIMGNNPGESHIIELNRYDAFKVSCNGPGESVFSNVLFGLDRKITVSDGLNVIVYDDLEEQIAAVNGYSE